MKVFYRFFFIIGLLVGPLGCMVGPDFHSPQAPSVSSYLNKPLPSKTVATNGLHASGKAQRFVPDAEIPPQWWALFHSPVINALILQGIANSPTLEAAEATLRQARYVLYAQIGTLLVPSVNGQFSGERERFSGSSLGVGNTSLFNFYSATLNVAYNLDIFGGARRQVEYYSALVDYQRYELIAAYLTLTSNIVTTAVNVASYTAQIKATRELIQAQQAQLDIIRGQYRLGGTAKQTVLTQETQVANTRASLPPLEKNLAQTQDALTVLVGAFPSQMHFPTIDLDQLNLPAELPLSMPSTLVRHRPDVQVAEALLHAASAQVGVATANMFPQIALTGSYGGQTDTLKNLFKAASNTWYIMGAVTQPIFQGGALWASRKAAEQAYHVALQQYEQTVLQAFQNVADVLCALEADARALKENRQAEVSALQNFKLTTEQYKLGAVDYLSLLTVQQQYQHALINRIQAQVARYNDTAALFQALGGNWWTPAQYPGPVGAKLNPMVT